MVCRCVKLAALLGIFLTSDMVNQYSTSHGMGMSAHVDRFGFWLFSVVWPHPLVMLLDVCVCLCLWKGGGGYQGAQWEC